MPHANTTRINPVAIDVDSSLQHLKTILQADGFDVARAPDGLWYWADEQDRTEVWFGEHATELHAWRDLAIAREHIAEASGINALAVIAPFLHFIYSHEEAKNHDGAGFWHRRAGWTTCDCATLYTSEEISLFSMTAFANDAVSIGYQASVMLAQANDATNEAVVDAPHGSGM